MMSFDTGISGRAYAHLRCEEGRECVFLSLYQRLEFERMSYELYMKLPALLIFVETVK